MNKKIHICFIGSIISVHLQRWIEKLLKDGFKVTVISDVPGSIKGADVYFIRDGTPKIFRGTKLGNKVGSIFLVPKIRKLINKINPNIVHVHYLDKFGYAASFSSFHPLIISVWGKDVIPDKPFSRFSLMAKKASLNKADAITATSRFLAKKVKEYVDREVKVIPFGIDFGTYKLQKRHILKNEPIKIGFFKHFKEKYGSEYLLKAFAKVVKKYNNLELFMVGKGELENHLKEVSRKMKIEEKVHFTGYIEKEEIPSIMSKMDLTIMPSVFDSESFGVAALESQSLSVPVIASNVGGVSEVVKDGETGILVTPRDVLGLEKAIIKLLEDEKLRIKMGKAGRRFVEENYNWDKNAKTMEKLYTTLVN